MRPFGRPLLGALCLTGMSVLGACSSTDDGSDASFSDVGLEGSDLDSAESELSAQLRAAGLESLASALDVVDVGQLINSSGFTLLAPSDLAFQSMDADEMGDLLADPDSLLAVLRNHVIDEPLGSVDLAALTSVRTQAGNDLDVVADSEGGLTIGGATVSSTDLSVEDGTVYIVDRILVP